MKNKSKFITGEVMDIDDASYIAPGLARLGVAVDADCRPFCMSKVPHECTGKCIQSIYMMMRDVEPFYQQKPYTRRDIFEFAVEDRCVRAWRVVRHVVQ